MLFRPLDDTANQRLVIDNQFNNCIQLQLALRQRILDPGQPGLAEGIVLIEDRDPVDAERRQLIDNLFRLVAVACPQPEGRPPADFDSGAG